ncbi:MAG: helix-turn-helix domain-containing protein [Gemmatimonadaceae bacterium]
MRFWKRVRVTDLLSQQEAAAFLGCSRMQINRWVRSGELPARDILGTSRIQVRALMQFAKRRGIALVRGRYLIA